jgi:hypothetical protein
MRPEPLTHDEGMRLGMGDVIKISAIRYDYGLGLVRRSPFSLNEELRKRFGLDSPPDPASLNVKEKEAAKPHKKMSAQDFFVNLLHKEPTGVPMGNYADLDTRTHKSVESWLEKTQQETMEVPMDNYVDLDKHQGPLDWAEDDGEGRAYEPVREIIETTNWAEKDDSLGRDVRPLTKSQLKRKKQQAAEEAKEREDRKLRELQEQQDKELGVAEETADPDSYNYFNGV